MNIKDLTAQDLEGTVIAFHDNRVIAIKGDDVSVAKCNSADTYSAQVGVGIALGGLFEPKDETFSPKDNDSYWGLDELCLQQFSEPYIANILFAHTSVLDVLRRKLNICYKTKEAAEKHKTEDVAKLKKYLKLDGE